MTLLTTLPWLLSAATIAQIWLTGNRWRWVWLFALANAGLWTWWAVASATWGMMPLQVFGAVVAIRNHLRWERERRDWEAYPESESAQAIGKWMDEHLKTPEGEESLRKAGL